MKTKLQHGRTVREGSDRRKVCFFVRLQPPLTMLSAPGTAESELKAASLAALTKDKSH